MSADLDREVDRAIRSMLDAEPRAGLPARVVASIEQRRRRRSQFSLWMSVAAATAAALLVLIFAPWRHAAPPVMRTADGRDLRLPAPMAQPIAPAPRVSETPASVGPRAPRVRHVHPTVQAASAEPALDSGIAALDHPAPLSVDTLASPVSSAMPSIQPAPLRVNALDLPALEMPPDAARGVDR